MSSIIEQLATQQVWEKYLAQRLTKGRFDWETFDQMDSIVENEDYLPLVQSILAGGGLSVPQKHEVNKMGTNKKRVVYSYKDDEMTMLKVVAYLLYKYDNCFASNCYAFRCGIRVSDAVRRVYRSVRKRKMWAYKLDIHNYFNSISIPILMPKLRQILADDEPLYRFFERILTDNRSEYNGSIIVEQRGVMAGIPVASFLANVYLADMDHHFANQGVVYARYSDDIIIFAEDYDTLQGHRAYILDVLRQHKLKVNPTKESLYSPEQPYEFLGFRCEDDCVDIARSGINKMKGKISRKARALLRRKSRKGLSSRVVMTKLIRYFNRKFFDGNLDDSLTWSRWYFPVINSVEGLREIDHYLQQYIRFLSTGRHTKANYRVSYEELKRLGYKSLVHEFYAQNRADAE